MIDRFFGSHVDPVVRTERIKLMAGGTQLVAIGILVGSFISPLFNPGLQITIWARMGAAVAAGLLELGALQILSYLPYHRSPEG